MKEEMKTERKGGGQRQRKKHRQSARRERERERVSERERSLYYYRFTTLSEIMNFVFTKCSIFIKVQDHF